MRRNALAPPRLRRRVAIVFVLAVGVATGVLALVSFQIVRGSRLDDAAARAVRQSTFNLRFAATEQSVPAMLDALRTRGDFCTVVRPASGEPQQSCLAPGPDDVPSALQAQVRAGQLARQRIALAGRHSDVVGGMLPGRGDELYFFYDEQQIFDDLDLLRDVLAGSWLVLLVLASLAGSLLAGRTLAPVAQASEAARALAEGLLDTRLPVDGRDEFATWASSFNEMADALQVKIRALSEAEARERRFTADVAHELRTPLTALVGAASLLADRSDSLPAETRKLATILVDDVGRLRHLVEDLLEISRLDAGSEATETELVNAGAVVGALLRGQRWAPLVEFEAEDVVLETDRRRLERILTNLIGNAILHGGTGVRVRVGQDGREAVFTITDGGPGISEEALPHVFDRFYKADRSRSAAGSGLGLAIARDNARLLGGDVTVASRPGSGAAFTLRLPVAKPLHGGERPVAGRLQDGDVPPNEGAN